MCGNCIVRNAWVYFPFVSLLVELPSQVSLSVRALRRGKALWWHNNRWPLPHTCPLVGKASPRTLPRLIMPVLETSWFCAHVLIPGGLWHPLYDPEPLVMESTASKPVGYSLMLWEGLTCSSRESSGLQSGGVLCVPLGHSSVSQEPGSVRLWLGLS